MTTAPTAGSLPGAPRTGVAGRRLPLLLVSRVIEQCTLGGTALLLAWRLTPEGFAPVSLLLVANSAAVTLSDYGVGLAALRRAPETRVAARALRSMRVANISLFVLGVAVALALRGDVAVFAAALGAIWFTSAEAFVRKAAAINLGHGHQAAYAELAGSLALVVAVLGFARGGDALAVLGVGLVLKHVIECVGVRRWTEAFDSGGARPELGTLWATQLVAYGLGNVDYLIVAGVLGATAFSIYSLGFRVASAIPSVLAYVATRTSLADLSALSNQDELRELNHRYVRRLFAGGAGGMLVVVGVAFMLPILLGQQWDALRPTVLVLAVGLPWRMIAGQAGSLAVASGATRSLLRWELTRLALFAVVFSAAALAGFGAFVGVVTVSWILGVTILHRTAARSAGIPAWGLLLPLAAASAIAVVVLVATVGPSS